MNLKRALQIIGVSLIVATGLWLGVRMTMPRSEGKPSPPSHLSSLVNPGRRTVPQKRTVYGHSLVPGGIWSVEALRDHAELYSKLGFDINLARAFRMTRDQCVHTAYLRDGKVYWTRGCVLVKAGELIYTDGVLYIRAQCGNLVSVVPEVPTEADPVDTEIPVGTITTYEPPEVPVTIQGPIGLPPSAVLPPTPGGLPPVPPMLIPNVPVIPGPPVRVPDGDGEFLFILWALVLVLIVGKWGKL